MATSLEQPIADREEKAALAAIRVRIERVQMARGNDTCADCLAADPEWASRLLLDMGSVGVFVCHTCAVHHLYELGEKRCVIKYLPFHHEWTDRELDILEQTGNAVAKAIYEAKMTPYDYTYYRQSLVGCPQEEEKRQARFIRKKYKSAEFQDVVALNMVLRQMTLKNLRSANGRTERKRRNSDRTLMKSSTCSNRMQRSASTNGLSRPRTSNTKSNNTACCPPTVTKVRRSTFTIMGMGDQEQKTIRKAPKRMESERSMQSASSLSMASDITGTSRYSECSFEDIYGALIETVMESDGEWHSSSESEASDSENEGWNHSLEIEAMWNVSEKDQQGGSSTDDISRSNSSQDITVCTQDITVCRPDAAGPSFLDSNPMLAMSKIFDDIQADPEQQLHSSRASVNSKRSSRSSRVKEEKTQRQIAKGEDKEQSSTKRRSIRQTPRRVSRNERSSLRSRPKGSPLRRANTDENPAAPGKGPPLRRAHTAPNPTSTKSRRSSSRRRENTEHRRTTGTASRRSSSATLRSKSQQKIAPHAA